MSLNYSLMVHTSYGSKVHDYRVSMASALGIVNYGLGWILHTWVLGLLEIRLTISALSQDYGTWAQLFLLLWSFR